MKIFSRFSNKIIVSYALVVGVMMAVLFIFFSNVFYNAHLDIIKREMDEKANLIELVIKERKMAYPAGKAGIAAEAEELAKIINLRITLVDFSGNVFADTEVRNSAQMDNHLNRVEISGAAAEGRGYSIRHSSSVNYDMLYCAKKSDSFFIRLAKPLNEIDVSLAKTRRTVVTVLLSSAGIGILIVFFIVRRVTRPIRETQHFAEQFAAGNFDRRILNYSDDEIGSVQRVLNKLADSVVEKMNSLAGERMKLTTAFETIPDGIALIQPDRTVEFVNSAFAMLFGGVSAVHGAKTYEVIRSRRINARIDDVIAGGKPVSFEEELSGGQVLEILITHVAGGSDGAPLLLVVRDVTEKKRIDRMKSDLVGNMSHELKTPIAIMKGYLETIQSNLHDAKMSRVLIDRAIENADRQNALINDILKLHMIETSAEIIRERVDLNEVISSCIKILTVKASERNVQISCEADAPAIVENGSRFLAEEILFNIIDNAVNYNNQGGSVTVSLIHENNGIICLVRDTGMGIPAESIDRIFERFYRVDKSRSRATGGTGLGLSIVRHAADLLGWRISVTSDAGGTEFRIVMG